MKRTALIVLAVAVAGWMENHSPISPTPDCLHLATTGEQALTAPTAVEVTALEDQALMSRLVEEGGSLIAQGKTVDAQVLIKELQFDKCQLALASPSTLTVAPGELYERVKDSVVVVAGLHKCTRCDKWHASPASGFVISADGAVATNYHVLDAADKHTFVVMTANGYVHPVTRVLAASQADDLAILKIDAEGLIPLPLAPHTPVGTPVSVISHPASHFYSLTSGIVSRHTRVRGEDRVVDAMEITADYARGSSGAPVFDAQGQVVGIVRSTESIYYNVDSGQQKNLQMVFKVCLPAKSLLSLIGE